jgi:hypothetical protein
MPYLQLTVANMCYTNRMENLYVAIISHLHISTCDGMTPKGLKMLKNIGETKKHYTHFNWATKEHKFEG